MIVGQPGSGKSTLARLLGEATGLPVHHMDHIHWMPGWKMRADCERMKMVRAVEDSDAWIFEGGFSRTFDYRRERADTLIFLDTPFRLRIWRVTWRFVRDYGKTRPDMAEGCPEGNWREMWVFYKFIWKTRRTARERILKLIASAPDGLSVVVIRNRSDVAQIVEQAHA